MANTYLIRSDIFNNGNRMIEAQVSYSSEDTRTIRLSIEPNTSATFTGGKKSTVISNNISPDNKLDLLSGALSLTIGSFAVLPGNFGEFSITNNLGGDVDIEICVIN